MVARVVAKAAIAPGDDLVVQKRKGMIPGLYYSGIIFMDEDIKKADASLGAALEKNELVAEVTPADASFLADVEHDAYADNPKLVTSATSVSALLKQAEVTRHLYPLSLKYERDGNVKGYILAFEKESDRTSRILPHGTRYIYVADFAVRNRSTVSGARAAIALLSTFMKRYKEHYLLRGNAIPVVFISREHTSKLLFDRLIPELKKILGIDLIISEPHIFKVGDDTMYQTVIQPIVPQFP